MALGGNAPIDHICDRLAKTPLADEVEARYDLPGKRSKSPITGAIWLSFN